MIVVFLFKAGRHRPSIVSKAALHHFLSQNKKFIPIVHQYDASAVPDIVRKYGVPELPTALLLDGDRLVEKRVGASMLTLPLWTELFTQVKL
jgi:hypothetical protein